MALITWQELSFRTAEHTLFEHVSGHLDAGERLHVTGPSGCGKTTLFRMLLGFLPVSSPVVYAQPPRTLIAAVPQNVALGEAGTVADLVAEVLACHANAAVRRSGSETLRCLWHDLRLPEDVAARPVAVLSGGERARVALALALVLPRPVLLLDEPFAALDVATAQVVADVLVRSGRTVLYTSHHDPVTGFATREVPL